MCKTEQALCLFCIYPSELQNQSQIFNNMKSKVIVAGDAAGNVVIPSQNNPEWGHIKVTQERILTDDRGWARDTTITALIPGAVKTLKRYGWKKGQELDGTIIFKEQLTPFNTKEPERDYKVAGKTKVVCCIDDQPIYRKTFYREDPTAKDVHILDENGNPTSHTNGDVIKAAYKELAEQEKAGVDPAGMDKM